MHTSAAVKSFCIVYFPQYTRAVGGVHVTCDVTRGKTSRPFEKFKQLLNITIPLKHRVLYITLYRARRTMSRQNTLRTDTRSY